MKNKFENYSDSRLIQELKSTRDTIYKPWINIIAPFILFIAEGYGIYILAGSSMPIDVIGFLVMLLMTWMGGCLWFIYGYFSAIRDEEIIINELSRRGKSDLL